MAENDTSQGATPEIRQPPDIREKPARRIMSLRSNGSIAKEAIMMQSPHILYALARQNDRIAPPRHVIEREPSEPAPVKCPANAPEPRTAWFWQLLFGRRGTAAS